ncbi:hypothetical protein ABT294_20675 [Nonomuraea sp. NPDC000554]|uniref:hypothetical protein n=1 Tax=Nonomuraea sp. NPDC000554 TaxID=3154259 RepID=UPI00332F0352
MEVMLPEGARAALEIMYGYPDIRTDEMHKDADAIRTVLAGADASGGEAEATMRRTQQVYQGDAATALADHWSRTGNSGGQMSQATAAARHAPMAIDLTAGVVKAVQVALISQAAYASWKIGRALLLGGPLAAVRANAEMLAARQMSMKIRREASEGATRVLAPIVRRRVIEALQRIAEKMRGPRGGGGPMLAGAGGHRIPFGGAGPAGRGWEKDGNVAQMGWGKGWTGGASDDAKKAAEEQVEKDVAMEDWRADVLDEQGNAAEAEQRRSGRMN